MFQWFPSYVIQIHDGAIGTQILAQAVGVDVAKGGMVRSIICGVAGQVASPTAMQGAIERSGSSTSRLMLTARPGQIKLPTGCGDMGRVWMCVTTLALSRTQIDADGR